MSTDIWRWAAPDGQQRKAQLDELRAGLASGVIAPNAPIWRPGWKEWRPATDVPELTTSALGAANGVVLNIPPPPLAVVAVQHELESKGAESFRPPPVEPVADDEPPPPPVYIPAPTKVPSSREGVSLPTTVGLPPPPELAALSARRGAARGQTPTKPPPPLPGARAALAPDSDESVEELSGSMLIDDASRGQLPITDPSGALPAPADPTVDAPADPLGFGSLPSSRTNPFDQLKRDIAAIRAGKPPSNKRLLIVAGVVVGSTCLLLLTLLISLVSGDSSDTKPAPSASTVTSATPPYATTSEAQRTSEPVASAAPVAAPKESPRAAADLGDCTLVAEAKSIGWRAMVPSGVEASAVHGALALGFASNPREGVVVSLEPSSLTAASTVKGRAVGGDARRVTPVLVQGTLMAAVDADRGADKLRGRRTVATSTPIDVGVVDNQIVWAPHGKDSWAKLFALDGEGAVEALRAIPLATSKGIALAFRRNGAIWLGVAKGEGMLEAQGDLHKIAGLGQVGSPSITASGDTLVVAWADRPSAQDDWNVRWTKAPVGGPPGEPRTLALPEGGLGEQAMSPSVVGLGGGRFLVAWTEGPVANHQVRAQTIGADGSPSGSVLSISPQGSNAGQPQVAIAPDGKGVVAFLAARGKAYEVYAAPVSCPPK